MTVLEGHPPDTYAGFRPTRGCRDNVCFGKEDDRAVITFIDYSAAFDSTRASSTTALSQKPVLLRK